MPVQVLSDDDRREIEARLAELRDVREVIARAKAAGIDVTEFEEQARDLEAQLLRLKQAFFPTGGKPARSPGG